MPGNYTESCHCNQPFNHASIRLPLQVIISTVPSLLLNHMNSLHYTVFLFCVLKHHVYSESRLECLLLSRGQMLTVGTITCQASVISDLTCVSRRLMESTFIWYCGKLKHLSFYKEPVYVSLRCCFSGCERRTRICDHYICSL